VQIIYRNNHYHYFTHGVLGVAGDVTSRDQSRGSCARGVSSDVTDAVSVSGKPVPARCRRASGGEPRDDDVTTTSTSGSYTVDAAQELCSEIDQMYFAPGSTNV